MDGRFLVQTKLSRWLSPGRLRKGFKSRLYFVNGIAKNAASSAMAGSPIDIVTAAGFIPVHKI
jgi:hypothetical protein